MPRNKLSAAFNANGSLDQQLEAAAQDGDFAAVKALIAGMAPDDIDKLQDGTAAKVVKAFIDPDADRASAARVSEIMQRIGSSGDGTSLGATIRAAAQSGNFETMQAIADHMTKDQVAEMQGSVTGDAVTQIVSQADGRDNEAAGRIDKLMKASGDSADGPSMSEALSAASLSPPAVKAIANNLSDDQVDALDAPTVGKVIQSLARGQSPARANAGAKDIDTVMKKIGRRADADDLGAAMADAAAFGQVQTVRAIADNLSPDQVGNFSPSIAADIIEKMASQPAGKQAEKRANDIADVLAKLPGRADGSALGRTMAEAAQAQDLPTLRAINAALTPDQVAKLDEQDAGAIVKSLVMNARPDNQSADAKALAEVLQKIGGRASNRDLELASSEATRFGNEAAFKAIMDNLPEHAKPASKFAPGPEAPATPSPDRKTIRRNPSPVRTPG